MSEPRPKSFVPVPPESHFPLQNLPYGVFKRRGTPDARPTIGTAIGDQVLDLKVLQDEGLLRTTVFSHPTLNPFMAAGRTAWREVRQPLTRLLSADEPMLRDNAKVRDRALVPMSSVDMLLPAHIGDYTDF